MTHYENFPVASLLCPPQLRAPIAAIYAFARTADDLADEGDASASQRLRDLADYREIDRLQRCMANPFTERAEFADFAVLPPAWADEICLSCSS